MRLQVCSREQFSLGSRVVSGGADHDQPGEFRSKTIIYGVFGQQTFGYDDKLFLTGAGCFGASSVFGKSERWQFFFQGQWFLRGFRRKFLG
ncbi:MAG: hypothetical protein U5J63_14765 [Fodinibius sp.]|nr:hypothetical protein [Fodinibius sp.]